MSSNLEEPRVEECVLRVVNLMKFPNAPGPTQVQFPFAYAEAQETNRQAESPTE